MITDIQVIASSQQTTVIQTAAVNVGITFGSQLAAAGNAGGFNRQMAASHDFAVGIVNRQCLLAVIMQMKLLSGAD